MTGFRVHFGDYTAWQRLTIAWHVLFGYTVIFERGTKNGITTYRERAHAQTDKGGG